MLKVQYGDLFLHPDNNVLIVCEYNTQNLAVLPLEVNQSLLHGVITHRHVLQKFRILNDQ